MRQRMLVLGLLMGCDGGGLPHGLQPTPPGNGPVIRWDLEAEPLPEIPFPNDIATWPDPTSPTGLRINAGLVAPTVFEQRLRTQFDQVDGWGTYAPVTVSFEEPIDTDILFERQGRGRFHAADFPRHAVYLINMRTGVPVPLDVGTGSYPYVVTDPFNPSGFVVNDPRGGGVNIIFETIQEDTNANGVLDISEDTDFDGVLDQPNTVDGLARDTVQQTTDALMTFYERETNTLILRPLLPLDETTQYTVVITDRLVGLDGSPVRSPFADVHHVAQREQLGALPAILRGRAHLYGTELADHDFEHIAFAWVFTTQSVGAEMRALRDGLYGRGPFAQLAEDFPPNLVVSPMRGGTDIFECDPGAQVYVVTPDQIRNAIDAIASEAFGISSRDIVAVLDTFEAVDYYAFVYFDSPYLLGDPEAENAYDHWELNRVTGDIRYGRETQTMFITIPKQTDAHQQPCPVTMYAHGYGNLSLESIAFSGIVARHGVATVALNAQGHGVPLDDRINDILRNVFAAQCLGPFATTLTLDRARDLNNDTVQDSAGLFFSAYMFHTRDAMRQTALDFINAVRILRTIDGAPGYPDERLWQPAQIPVPGSSPLVSTGDVNADGVVDRMGDFDGNGVPDIGGWDRPYAMWGVSLGGIITGIVSGMEPAITTAAPVSGGAGLFDIGLRSNLNSARDPIWLRVMGPFVSAVPSGGVDENTGCIAGELSFRFILPDLNEERSVEFACVPAASFGEGDVVIARNPRNRETRCAVASPDGRFTFGVPADVDDGLVIELYDAAAGLLDTTTCRFTGEASPVAIDTISTWRSSFGRAAPGFCRRCGIYQGRQFVVEDPLVFPAEGLGLRRQSPDLRRITALSQLALDPADPASYGPRMILDPITAPDVATAPRNLLVMMTGGDPAVPTAAGMNYARAAGVLPFLPFDAPSEFAEYRAPASFEAFRGGVETPNDLLVDLHVIEGVAAMGRHPVTAEVPNFLYDVDDLSEGRQRFRADGGSQVPLGNPDSWFRPNRLDPPLRWVRASRAMDFPGDDAVWQPSARDPNGISGVLAAMIYPRGNHVFDLYNPEKPFDEAEYLVGLIGWYLASGGHEPLYYTSPSGHHCLEDNTCVY